MRRLLALTLGMMFVGFLSLALAGSDEYCGDHTDGCTNVWCLDVGEGGVCTQGDPPTPQSYNHYTAGSLLAGVCLKGGDGCTLNGVRCTYRFYQLDPWDFDCEADTLQCLSDWVDPTVCN